MWIQLLIFTIGLVLLVYGAESFVKGASTLAIRMGVSRLVIGMTLVGFGTSLPELSINLTAAVNGRLDLAVGNVVGSNIANVGLILGVAALLTPLVIHIRLLRLEIPLLLLASAGLWLLGFNGTLGWIEGAMLLIGFIGLMMVIGYDSKTEPELIEAELVQADPSVHPLTQDIFRILLGFVLLLAASQMMVGSAVELARAWGMTELMIGLTIVAIGTSLPELAASGMAAWRGESDIAVGNVLGSCLFNILLVLGATAIIEPLPVAASLIWREIPLMFLFAAALYPLAFGDKRISRSGGVLLLSAYAAFLAWQVYLAG